ncbi:MAG: phosphonate lyase system protein PhnH [Frondihabitans sp.]|nr:phosphonate lyase system protein PhnH [Frondihabitans sp.]
MIGQAEATPAIPAPGFADATRDAQRAFRAILDALSHPTTSQPLIGPADPPSALGRGLGAIALTILDEECSLWLGSSLDDGESTAWLAFHTGARRASDPAEAEFVFADVACLPRLGRLARGTEEEPHRSATVVLDVRGCTGTARFRAEGPGIDGATVFDAPWADDDFLPQWNENSSLFPRGVDLLLVDVDTVAALPRTTRLEREA